MQALNINGCVMHVRVDGPDQGRPVVFSNSLGTDLRVWDPILPFVPSNWRVIRYDTRGHGLSGAPKGPYHMGDLVSDAAGLLDELNVGPVTFVGLSIGGIIAQGLAAERPDLIEKLVLSNTACKIGAPDQWQDRIDLVTSQGLVKMSDAVLERWLSARFRAEHETELEMWRAMLTRTPEEGYAGCCAAIAETDLYESTARLKVPTLAIAGSEDQATPVDLVRETAELIEGSQFHVLRKCGHIPPAEQPEIFAKVLSEFVSE